MSTAPPEVAVPAPADWATCSSAEGWASKIKPLSTAQMAKRYAAGELAQAVVVARRAAE